MCWPISTAGSTQCSTATHARSASNSTIVALLDDAPRLLRPGGVSRTALEKVLGCKLLDANETNGKPLAPGLLASHYAPRAQMRLEAASLAPGEAGLDFGGRFAGAGKILDLSPKGDLIEAAANLFTFLRMLDAGGTESIAVAPVPHHDLGEAINDRLRRAAAPREP